MSVEALTWRSSSGDTIVEVLIVLAVLGLAIGIAYATANRSLINSRQAQENSIATTFVQGQMEGLRVLSPSATSGIYTGTVFCLQLNSGNYSVSPSACRLPFDPASSLNVYYCGGQATGFAGGICAGLTDDTFVTQAQWTDAAGQGTDSVTQVYRVHVRP